MRIESGRAQNAGMKTNLTQRRYKAEKHSACPMCKPYKRGWEDKKTTGDLRVAIKHEQELQDARYARASQSRAQPD